MLVRVYIYLKKALSQINWISKITSQLLRVFISWMPEYKVVVPVILKYVIREAVQLHLEHVSNLTVYSDNCRKQPPCRFEKSKNQHATPQWEENAAIKETRNATIHGCDKKTFARELLATTRSNRQLNRPMSLMLLEN